MRLIIGFTGAFGSGCSFIAKYFFTKEFKYTYFSLSKKLRDEYMAEESGESGTPKRSELQEYGNKKRKQNPSYLANAILDDIENEPNDQNIVIDSIRNPAEIKYFREKFPDFILVAVFADYDVRWDRVKDDYDGSKDCFDKDEKKDQGNFEPKYGQNISNCFFQADLIISNNININVENHNDNFNEMYGKLKNYIKDFEDPTSSKPTNKETLMAMAYAVGRQSRCIKRRVGAVIVDGKKNVLSTGFNSEPIGLHDCEGKFGVCYRDQQRGKLKKEIKKLIDNKYIKKEDVSTETKIEDDIVDGIKILELCRAMHAEENAIINLVGRSVNGSLSDATLFVTTYPCNLCANKIVQIGIKNVVYFEPYPVVEAKEIFEAGKVKTEPFEGITFRAFFKAFNYEQ